MCCQMRALTARCHWGIVGVQQAPSSRAGQFCTKRGEGNSGDACAVVEGAGIIAAVAHSKKRADAVTKLRPGI
jgi:hypothetical protein